MARKKLEEPEKWITVNGQHLPVYPGGRIGAPGQKEIPNKKKSGKSYSLDKKDDNNYRVTNPEKGTSYTMTAKDAEDAWKQVVKAQRSGKIDQFDFGPEHIESLKPKKQHHKDKFDEHTRRMNILTSRGMSETNAQKYLSYEEKASRLEHELNTTMDSHSTNWVRQRKEEIQELKDKMKTLRYGGK